MTDEVKKTSIDALFGGDVLLEQPVDGYRVNIDSALLAGTLRDQSLSTPLLDVGTGVGILGVSLAKAHPTLDVTCVEIQPELAALAARNVERNGLNDRVEVMTSDVRELGEHHPARFGTAVMNPPYFEPGRGRISAVSGRAAARHQLHGTISELLVATTRTLVSGGSLFAVYPSRFLPAFLEGCAAAGLSLSRLRFVHPRAGSDATTVIICARRTVAATELCVDPPLFLREGDDYSPDAAKLLASRL